MAKYTVSRLARIDLENITEYTERHYGFAQAREYLSQIHRAAEIVAEFPSIGRHRPTQSGRPIRQFNCGQHALFYEPRERDVLVVRVLHLATDMDRFLG